MRCALSKAIDRNEYVEALSNGIATPASGVFSPGQEGYLADNGFSIEQDIAGAKALIDEYEAETGTQVSINYGTTTSQINAQRAELMKGWWEAIGVDVEYQQVPQDSFITDALFGVPTFFAFAWRQHAGLTIDTQNYWWNSRGAHPDGELSLNFARIRDDDRRREPGQGPLGARSRCPQGRRRSGQQADGRAVLPDPLRPHDLGHPAQRLGDGTGRRHLARWPDGT